MTSLKLIFDRYIRNRRLLMEERKPRTYYVCKLYLRYTELVCLWFLCICILTVSLYIVKVIGYEIQYAYHNKMSSVGHVSYNGSAIFPIIPMNLHKKQHTVPTFSLPSILRGFKY